MAKLTDHHCTPGKTEGQCLLEKRNRFEVTVRRGQNCVPKLCLVQHASSHVDIEEMRSAEKWSSGRIIGERVGALSVASQGMALSQSGTVSRMSSPSLFDSPFHLRHKFSDWPLGHSWSEGEFETSMCSSQTRLLTKNYQKASRLEEKHLISSSLC